MLIQQHFRIVGKPIRVPGVKGKTRYLSIRWSLLLQKFLPVRCGVSRGEGCGLRLWLPARASGGRSNCERFPTVS